MALALVVVAAVVALVAVVAGPEVLVDRGFSILFVILPAWGVVVFVVPKLFLLYESLAASKRNSAGFTFVYVKPNAARPEGARDAKDPEHPTADS